MFYEVKGSELEFDLRPAPPPAGMHLFHLLPLWGSRTPTVVLPTRPFSPNAASSRPNTSHSGMYLLSSARPFPRPYLLITQHNTHSGTWLPCELALGAAPIPPTPHPRLRNLTKNTLFLWGVLEARQAAHLRKSVTIPKQEGGPQNVGTASP